MKHIRSTDKELYEQETFDFICRRILQERYGQKLSEADKLALTKKEVLAYTLVMNAAKNYRTLELLLRVIGEAPVTKTENVSVEIPSFIYELSKE